MARLLALIKQHFPYSGAPRQMLLVISFFIQNRRLFDCQPAFKRAKCTMSNLHPSFQLGHAAASNGLELLPNTPNPFIEMTLLRFRLPEATDVTLRFFDAEGREVSTRTTAGEAGDNQLRLSRTDFRQPGIYTYLLETAFGSAVRRLIMY